jgi:hypothetical protein
MLACTMVASVGVQYWLATAAWLLHGVWPTKDGATWP